MSGGENFMSRWSRLKREPDTAPSKDALQPDATPTADLLDAVADEHPAPVEALAGAQLEPEFDPASLPAVESIQIDTDIRGFLQPRVPAELTRAALRQAWTSDPAIRDFIGVAENQWDFNDPTSIFGFGPMRATDNVPALLAQALGKLEDVAGKVMAQVDPSGPARLDDGASVTIDLPPDTETVLEAEGREVVVATAAANDAAVSEEVTRQPRQHGGALPR